MRFVACHVSFAKRPSLSTPLCENDGDWYTNAWLGAPFTNSDSALVALLNP